MPPAKKTARKSATKKPITERQRTAKRPKYTDAQKERISRKIFELITYGTPDKATGRLKPLTIKEACAKAGISQPTYYDWVQTDPKQSLLSAHAREIAGHKHCQNAAEVLEDVREGELDPQAGKLLFDGYMRLAGICNRVYGERKSLDMGGAVAGSGVESITVTFGQPKLPGKETKAVDSAEVVDV